MRSGSQPVASARSDPSQVGTLAVHWGFPAQRPGLGNLRASSIVVGNTVFIGNLRGYFYALDAATGALIGQYPPSPNPPLLGQDPMWHRYPVE
jgi:hypothetical protein